MYKNNDPSAPWNDPYFSNDPLSPHNDPIYRDDPTKPWNNPAGSSNDLNDRERSSYGLRQRSRSNSFYDDDF